MSGRRSGVDTCCARCSLLAKCMASPSKTRNPCTLLADSESCVGARKGRHKFCTVCPSFKGAGQEDSNQMKMFEGDAP